MDGGIDISDGVLRDTTSVIPRACIHNKGRRISSADLRDSVLFTRHPTLADEIR